MHLPLAILSSLPLLSLLALALASPSPQPTPQPDVEIHIQARQSSGSFPISIPANCTSQCAVVSAIANCTETTTDATCVCSNTVGWELLQCINCGVALGGVLQQQVQSAQAQLNSFVQGCDQAGATISPLTIGVTASSPATLTTSAHALTTSAHALTPSSVTLGATATTGKNAALKGRRIPGGMVGLVVGVVLSVWIVGM